MQVRVRLWGMLVAVAAVSGLLAVGVEWQRRARLFARKAVVHDDEASSAADFAWSFVRMPTLDRDQDTRMADRYRKLHDYLLALRRKYERAARQPWLPVAPDPPEPD